MLPYPPFENHCIKKTRSKHIDVFRRLFADLGNPAGIWLDPSENNDSPLVGSPLALEKVGSLDAQRVVHQHQGWRLISCMWLHAGVFHVLANMLSLVFIGIRLEQEFGFALFIQYGISVGAAGALFGLLGSMLSELTSNWTMYVNKLAALLTLLFIIIIT